MSCHHRMTRPERQPLWAGQGEGRPSNSHGALTYLPCLLWFFSVTVLLSFACMRKQVVLRLDVGLLARVELARGDVSRQVWLVRAVERALGLAGSSPVREGEVPERVERSSSPASARPSVHEEQVRLNEASAARAAVKMAHNRQVVPSRTSGHLPTCQCGMCKPVKS